MYPWITIACLSRYLGNRDSNLKRMLQSLSDTVFDPLRIEVLIKIDDDDDLEHYAKIKRRFGRHFPLRMFATPHRRGPADMHHFYAELLERAAPSAKLWLIATDDAVFTRPNWDGDLAKAIDDNPSGLFVGGDRPFEEVTALETTAGGFQHYGTNDYPFCGMELLRRCALPEPGWTPFGRSLCVDTYFSTLVATAWETQRRNIYVQVPKFLQRTGIVSFAVDPPKNSARTAGIRDVTSASHRALCERIITSLPPQSPTSPQPSTPSRS